MSNHCRNWLDGGRIEGHWREPIGGWIFARTKNEKKKYFQTEKQRITSNRDIGGGKNTKTELAQFFSQRQNVSSSKHEKRRTGKKKTDKKQESPDSGVRLFSVCLEPVQFP